MIIRTRIVTLASYAVIIAVLLTAWGTLPRTVAQGVAAPVVLLEATNRHWGIGGYDPEYLFLRLRTDGRIEWDEWTSQRTTERHTASISPSVVAEVQSAIDNVDRSKVREKMGPYFVDIDSGNDLHIRARAKTGVLRFTLVNPWYTGMLERQMPADVRALFCQIDNLISQNTKQKVDRMCTAEK